MEALQQVARLGTSGPAMVAPVYAHALLPLKAALVVQLGDLRSQITKEACVAATSLAGRLGPTFEAFADGIFPVLIRLLGNTKIAMSGPALQCLQDVVAGCSPLPSLDVVLRLGALHKNTSIAAHSIGLLVLALRSHKDAIAATGPAILDHLHTFVSHASEPVRVVSRELFSECAGVYREEDVAAVFKRLDSRSQHALLQQFPALKDKGFVVAAAQVVPPQAGVAPDAAKPWLKARQPLGDKTNATGPPAKPWLTKGAPKPWLALQKAADASKDQTSAGALDRPAEVSVPSVVPQAVALVV